MPPTHREIVAHFKKWSPRQIEIDHYAEFGAAEASIARAVLSVDSDGRRNGHQRRIPQLVLNRAKRRLVQETNAILQCTDFQSLYGLIGGLIRPIRGVGELLIYDTAQRLCLAMGLPEPDVVYLHAGTREGARRLEASGRTVAIRALPKEYRRLSSFELEDLFCNYKRHLAGEALPDGPLSRRAPRRRRFPGRI
ncbi:hypothetical protein [Variovorax sp. IB41]|uniref:hypothetical protein n=1 Tax=Variovorax sp. IB41 TaxID=2779370 RepID=UPI0018E816FF|nr:hypothetical protein [Variovorax sp. IB41]MBJ2155295.1 hypothetical protein [Variovorax sp. IB41]